jgi:hypothetical protein
MDREGAHFTGLLEDTCPDVVDVKLCVAHESIVVPIIGIGTYNHGEENLICASSG